MDALLWKRMERSLPGEHPMLPLSCTAWRMGEKLSESGLCRGTSWRLASFRKPTCLFYPTPSILTFSAYAVSWLLAHARLSQHRSQDLLIVCLPAWGFLIPLRRKLSTGSSKIAAYDY